MRYRKLHIQHNTTKASAFLPDILGILQWNLMSNTKELLGLLVIFFFPEGKLL